MVGEKDTYIHKSAEVSANASIGAGTKIWHQAQVRENAKIGKDCILGKSVYVDESVVVGDRVKLQNRVSVYKGVTIEDDVFVGPHVSFTNDLYPRAFRDFEVDETLVKKGASICTGSIIVCGLTIGAYAMVGAGSVVTKDVPAHGLVFGNPAHLTGFICDCTKKMRLKERQEDHAIYQCPECGREILVPKEIVKSMQEESN